jgi:GxxExxY protein
VNLIDRVKFCAEEVHIELGPGHSETVYETALAVELVLCNTRQRTQVPCVLNYKGCDIGVGFIDLLVEEELIVEIKTVAKLTEKDEAQVRKYLVAAKKDKGLLINFGSDLSVVEVEKGSNHGEASSTEDRNSDRTLLCKRQGSTDPWSHYDPESFT